MAINIKRILNKKNPTGEEVGQAFLANTAAGYERLLNTRDYSAETKGIFTQEELKQMRSRLTTSNDIRTYNAYISIDDYIAKEQGFASAYQQQANLAYYKLYQEINRALEAEERIDDSTRGPLIITKKQFDDYCNEVRKEERKITITYFEFIGKIFRYYYDQYRNNPDKENPLSNAIKISLEKVITNKRLLKEYVKSLEKGCYITRDGIRSDECSSEEWEEIADKIIYEESSLNATNNFIQSKEIEPYIGNVINLIKAGRHFYLDKTIPLIDDNFTWIYDTPPEELESKYILDNLTGYYVYLFEYPYKKGKSEKQLEEFMADFPELYESLIDESEILLPSTKTFTPKLSDRPIATWGELADRDILDYKYRIDKIYSHQIIEYVSSKKDTIQGLFHGIAIMRDEDLDELNVDENGYYVQPDLLSYALKGEVRNLASDDYCPSFIKSVREEELVASMREVYAFNTIINLISEITEVDLSVFSMEEQTKSFEKQVIALNNLILTLYSKIEINNIIFDQEEGMERSAKAKELFPLIRIEDAKPTATAIAKTKEYISDLHAFKINSPLIIEKLKER